MVRGYPADLGIARLTVTGTLDTGLDEDGVTTILHIVGGDDQDRSIAMQQAPRSLPLGMGITLPTRKVIFGHHRGIY